MSELTAEKAQRLYSHSVRHRFLFQMYTQLFIAHSPQPLQNPFYKSQAALIRTVSNLL